MAAGYYLKNHEDTFNAWSNDNYMHFSGIWLKYYLGFFWATIYLTLSVGLMGTAAMMFKS